MQALHNNLKYKVVANRERQYSLWPANRESPLGWKDVGFLGSRNDCFSFIEKVWHRAQPLNLRGTLGAPSIAARNPSAQRLGPSYFLSKHS